MGLDEAILEAISSGHSPPTLRLYAWEPATLSIGYAQPISQVDQAGLNASGWGLVRRPTGGKAILHTDELTYSIIGPSNSLLFTGGVLASYERLSAGLLAALAGLDLAAQLHPVGSTNGDNPICFQDPGAHELTVAGMKLLGSAQLRRAAAVLQHGSLPLVGDIGRICWALKYDSAEAREQAAAAVRRDATTLERALGREIAWREAAEAFADGFRTALKLDLHRSEPSPVERHRANALRLNRYEQSEWNHRI